MRAAKEIALISIFTALLIGGQFALSAISGVEVVTVLLLAFSYYFGIRRGILVATAFSLLRCLIFGFFPTVIILYLIYYNLFVIVFGLWGMKFKRGFDFKVHAVLLITAIFMTACFTLLDNVITPLYWGFSADTTKAYWVSSVPTLVVQVVCACVTVLFLLPPLLRILAETHFIDKKAK